jgi:esterase/lipase superfamily enzyme
MNKRETQWYSHNVEMEMPLVAYGYAGYPLLMFPTAAADYLEYERFLLIDAISPFIKSGMLRAYSVNSVNRYVLFNHNAHPAQKAELLTRYDRYITDEVLPLIKNECGQDARPLTTGASMGAYLAANIYFKHPDLFRGTIAMSGSYDIRGYMDGYFDDNVYFNNPIQYLQNLNDDYHLPRLRSADSIIIFTGQGEFEDPARSRNLSNVLHSKSIPHWLDVWGHDVKHDWDWWRKALPYYLDKFFN